MDAIQEDQGWTDETMLELLKGFILKHKLTDEVVAFLVEVADEENGDAGV